MLNADTDNTLAMQQAFKAQPYSVDYHLSGDQIERAALPPHERDNFNMNSEEAFQPNYWHAQEQDRDKTPAPVVQETNVSPTLDGGEQTAHEMAQLTKEQREKYILDMGPFVITARHQALYANPN